MARPSTKDGILDAAEAIVIESGAAHMTLDAVARRSGVSKGGLIYHFHTKKALLQAMIDRMIEHIDRMREKIRRDLPEESSNELMVEMRVFQRQAESRRLQSAALLAVVASNPDLMGKAREEMRERFNKKVTSGAGFERSSILLFASMGIYLHDLLNLSVLDKEQKEAIQKELLRLAGSGDPL
jgi:AcrR family transcriptional regulator